MVFLVACLALYMYTVRHGLRGSKNVKLYGPVALIRCEKCAQIIERFTPKWIRLLGPVAVVVWLTGMVAGMALLVGSAIASLAVPPEYAPPPSALIGLPGLNPLIPLWYGLTGLIVAVILHELAHGFEARANGIPIKSAGVLLLVLPLGAFVEPGEQLQDAKPITKAKVFSAGPFANILAMLLIMLLISQQLTGVAVKVQGVGITAVMSSSPAEKAGIQPGDIIVRVDDVEITNLQQFLSVMASKKAGEKVTLTLSGGREVAVILADKYSYSGKIEDRGVGFIGISLVDLDQTLSLLTPFSNPFSDPLGTMRNLLIMPALLPPSLLPYLKSFYTQPISGWETLYMLLWIAWMNFAVGLANMLPIIPFDGGNALKAVLEPLTRLPFFSTRRKAIDTVVGVISIITVALIIAPVIVPRLLPLLRLR